MLEQNPGDAFARYGLAMELVNTGDPAGAVEQFALLLLHNPNYTAGYFHGGQTLEKLGRTSEAKEMYTRGIDVAQASGDAHTRAELEGALSQIG